MRQGDPPVLAIVDPGNVTEMAEERFLDLSGEDWVADGGDTMGTKVNDVLYGFPAVRGGSRYGPITRPLSKISPAKSSFLRIIPLLKRSKGCFSSCAREAWRTL